MDDKLWEQIYDKEFYVVEPEEDSPRHEKMAGSVYLEMLLLGETKDDFKLVAVSDDKRIVFDKVCPYSSDYTLTISAFRAEESLVGVIIYQEPTVVIACSNSRKCVVQDFRQGTYSSRVFHTGEDIDFIFPIGDTVFLAIFNKRSNSVGFFEIEELRYRD